MKIKKFSILILISLLILACNYTGAPTATDTADNPVENSPEAPESEATPETTSEVEAGTSPTQSTAAPTDNPPAPAPTAANPGSNPGGSGSGSSSSNQPLTIGAVSSYPNSTVYYGTCGASDPTVLHVESTIEPLDQIQQVLLWFDIFSPAGAVVSGSDAMWQLGIGDYAGDIDIGQIGPGSMGTADGSISFWIEAVHKDGTSAYSSTYSINIEYCPDAVIGNQPAAAPVIVSFTDNSPVSAGEWVELAWLTTDATCGAELDGNSVDSNGYYSYSTSPGDAGSTFNHTLVAYGEPCSNPSQTSETVSVSITAAVTTSKGGGTLFDEYSLDLDGIGGDDIMFDVTSSDTLLLSLFGTEIIAGSQADVHGCKSALSGGGYGALSILPNDLICYRTGSGNYGYLTINGMYIDLDNYLNTNVDVSYTTEVQP